MLRTSERIKHTAYVLLLLAFAALFNSGCNTKGTGSWEKYDTAGNVTESGETTTPQDVGVVEALAPMMEKCEKDKESNKFIPALANDCAPSTGVTDRAECYRSNKDIAMTNTLGLVIHNQQKQIDGEGKTCAEAVASVGIAYFEKEAVQAKQIGSGTKAAVVALATFGITKELVAGFVAGSSTGDTNVNEINVSANNPAGAGTEGTGGSSGDLNQYVNIGPGSIDGAASGGSILSGEKATMGDGNQDNDSPNTSLF